MEEEWGLQMREGSYHPKPQPCETLAFTSSQFPKRRLSQETHAVPPAAAWTSVTPEEIQGNTRGS